MKITYDSEADALYISLRKASAADAVDIEEGVVADLDGEGHVISFEILDASKRLNKKELSELSIENLVSEQTATVKLPA
jgi:uncharacterized protein YuzE